MSGLKYRRVLLKLSGEALMGERGYGPVEHASHEIADDEHDDHRQDVRRAHGDLIKRFIKTLLDGLIPTTDVGRHIELGK